MGSVRKLLRGFAGVVLDFDDTSYPQEQFDVISSHSKRFTFNTEVKELNSLVKILTKKHLVDSIAVVEKDGSVVVSSNGTSFSEGIKASALLNYISSEMPRSSTVMIKDDAWYMLYPFKGKIYIVKAHNNLTTIEMRAIAREIDNFFSQSC